MQTDQRLDIILKKNARTQSVSKHKECALTDFSFDTQLVDRRILVKVWRPEIENAAQKWIVDNRHKSFFIASLRLAIAYQNLNQVSIEKISQKSGYSRSTFFRLFGKQSEFILKTYQMICWLSVKVYKKYLNEKKLDTEEFVDFTISMFFGSNLTFEPPLIQSLWHESQCSHRDFHPHLEDLSDIVVIYLRNNESTKHIPILSDDITRVLGMLDLEMLNAKLENSSESGTPKQYIRLKHILRGYLYSISTR